MKFSIVRILLTSVIISILFVAIIVSVMAGMTLFFQGDIWINSNHFVGLFLMIFPFSTAAVTGFYE